MDTAWGKKRHYLTLKEKIEVIKASEKDRGLKHDDLARKFKCGRTQISRILKNKKSILSLYGSNRSASMKKMSRTSTFEDVNNALYDWYLIACFKNIYSGGPQLVEKAKQIAERLGRPEFKGSNGWLAKWKARYNIYIRQFKVCGESGDVRGETVESWKERLPDIVKDYSIDDIWNMDETGIFWKTLPESGFGQKGKSCNGGKKSKQRMTVAFFVSASGVKEKPVVIWKSENPRCFKMFDKSILPVSYHSQKKSWMTGDIMKCVLTNRLQNSNRFILLLLDNAGCHPESLESMFSNIKLCFLPPNTTSKLQPLDLGIIQNFKVHYRTLLLKYVIAKIDECECATEVIKSVNILVAIRWVAQAWAKVKKETIMKCFRKASVLDQSMEVVSCGEEDDPFLDLDQWTLDTTIPGHSCTPQEYVNGDSNLPVCAGTGDYDWEENFLAQLQ